MTGQERRRLFANSIAVWKDLSQVQDMSFISSMFEYKYRMGTVMEVEPIHGFNMLSIKPSSDLDNFLRALELIKINHRRRANLKKAQRKKAAKRRLQHGK